MAKRRASVSLDKFLLVAIVERARFEGLNEAADELGMSPGSLYQKVLTHNRNNCTVGGEVDPNHALYIKPWPPVGSSGSGSPGSRSRGVPADALAALIAKAKATVATPQAGGADSVEATDSGDEATDSGDEATA